MTKKEFVVQRALGTLRERQFILTITGSGEHHYLLNVFSNGRRPYLGDTLDNWARSGLLSYERYRIRQVTSVDHLKAFVLTRKHTLWVGAGREDIKCVD